MANHTTNEPTWPWGETAVRPLIQPEGGTSDTSDLLAQAAARCFRDGDGDLLLAHLKSLTLDRAVGPGVSDTALRHLEGQRALVSYLDNLITRGRTGN